MPSPNFSQLKAARTAKTFLLAAALSLCTLAQAQTTTIVVPGGAGGTPDMLARQIAEAISKHTGKAVIVDNKVGAGGSIGGRFVTRAKPDGLTLLITSSGITGTAGHLYPDYHPVEKLEHFMGIADVPFVVVSRKDFPATDPKDFIAYVRANPKQVRWSNAGFGTHGNLTQILLQRAGNLQFDIIPYKGSMPALNDLLGGHVDAALDNVATYKVTIESQKVNAVFVTSKERVAYLPNVPTARELGIPLDNIAWYALAAPKGTPKAVLDDITAALKENFFTDANKQRYAALGLTLVMSTREETQRRAEADFATFGKIIKEYNMAAGQDR